MKSENRKIKLIHNGIYGSLSWFLPLVLAFFSTPILIRGLGTENYGIFALIIGFIGYTFNFGIGRAVTKYVSEYLSQNRVEEAVEVVSSTIYISIFLAFIANFIIVLFADSIVRDVLQISPERQKTAIYALYISGATICVLLVSQIYQALIQSAHRFDRLAIIININGVLLAVGNIVWVLSGYGVLTLIWFLSSSVCSRFAKDVPMKYPNLLTLLQTIRLLRQNRLRQPISFPRRVLLYLRRHLPRRPRRGSSF